VKVKNFRSILESGSLGESDPVSLASQVGGGKLHLLMEEVLLLFLENLSEVFIQGEEGGGHSGLGNKLVRPPPVLVGMNKQEVKVYTEAEERQ
jgi:hypothetical protein